MNPGFGVFFVFEQAAQTRALEIQARQTRRRKETTMEENGTPVEQTAETTDAFLDGWDDAESPVTEADQPEQQETEAKGETDAQSPTGEEQTEEEKKEPAADGEVTDAKPGTGEEPQTEAEKAAGTTPKSWKLRHLGEEKTVNEQELTSLAQKGLDYDRIHEKYEEFRPVMELFNQFATKAGMKTRDYIAYIRQEAKKAEGMNADEAKRAVELEDREASVAAKEAAEQEKQKEQRDAEARKQTEDQRRMADIQEFQKTFPDAAKDPQGIPKEVWDGVRSGLSLVASYARWQVEQAKKETAAAEHKAAAAQQNQKNTARSTGSMRSAGEENKSRDPFLDGWNS